MKKYENSPRIALIIGVNGQDGSFLSQHLRDRGYRVVGTTRSTDRVSANVRLGIELISLDIRNSNEIDRIVSTLRPTELYNLAARSSSKQLFDDPVATTDVNGVSVIRFLEAIRKFSPQTRFCQAASSEIFAGTTISPQDERTPFSPVNAYGAAKALAINVVNAYRLQHGLFACSAILFNHESPNRSDDFVTRKITRAVARIKMGLESTLTVGSLESRRDWGFAGDYVVAMWLMLQQPVAEDFVIATGISHSVREFCKVAFARAGLDYQNFLRVDPNWVARREDVELRGNPTKAWERLKWLPAVDFVELVHRMVDSDIDLLKSQISRNTIMD